MRCLLHDEPCSLQLCHETGECSFPTVCYPSASQPNPTPQEPTAPTLEQLAEGDVDNNIRREIRIFNDGGGWMWIYYNDPLPPYSPFSRFADKKAAIRSAKRFIESVSKSTIFYLHGDEVSGHWERV